MRWFAAWFLFFVSLGCSKPEPQAEDFIPAEDPARTALQAALEAWKEGKTATQVEGSNPAIEVVDARLEGRTLTDYEILGSVPGEAPRCFAVKLTLGNPTKSMTERYVVLGLNPIWIWRYEDYVMLTHWDHRMKKEKTTNNQKP